MADIGILGTIHDHEMREKVGFTFNLLEKVITGFKIVHNITWTSRNQIICERIKKVVDTNPGKRVLCTIGVEHCYFLKDYFDFYKQYEVIFPLTLTT